MGWLHVSDEILEQSPSVNTAVEQLLATTPPVHLVPPAVSRANRINSNGPFPAPVKVEECRNRTIPGRAGNVTVRVCVPDEIRGVYLHLGFHAFPTAIAQMAVEAQLAFVERAGTREAV